MNSVTLNNGVKMPVLGLGVYKVTEDEMEKVIHSAIDAGYRAFDTAHFYFNEAALGKALKSSGIPREELFITTKLWNDDQGYDNTIRAFNESLQKLDTDYIDLYLIHWPCPENQLFTETYKAMETLYHEGKVKAIGVCNFKEHHLETLMNETSVKPVVNQIEYHPLFDQKALQDFCEDNEILVTAWSPLMRGGELFHNETLIQLGTKYDKTPAQIVIRWHIDSGRIVIPKTVTPSRLQENIDVFDFKLSSDDMNLIDMLNRNERQFKDPDLIKIGDMK